MSALPLSWPRLLRIAAVTEMVLLFIVGFILLDREAIVFAVIVALTSAWILLRHGSRIAVVIRGLVFLDVEFFMFTAAVSNIGHHEAIGPVLAPLALSVTSAVGIIATIAFFMTRGRAEAGTSAVSAIAVAAVVVFIAGLGYSSAAGLGNTVAAKPGDAVISATNARFSTPSLHARGKLVTVYMTNNDLFWHTFTVDSLGVNMQVPVKGHRSVTFNAPAGSYEFHCAIPGHKAAGMHGTLTVT